MEDALLRTFINTNIPELYFLIQTKKGEHALEQALLMAYNVCELAIGFKGKYKTVPTDVGKEFESEEYVSARLTILFPSEQILTEYIDLLDTITKML